MEMMLGEVKYNKLEWDRMGSHVSNKESGIVKYLIKRKKNVKFGTVLHTQCSIWVVFSKLIK